MPLTEGCSHVATMTDDPDRLMAFYGRVFDAETIFDMEEEGLRHVDIDIGGSAVLHAFHVPWVEPDDRRSMFERGRIDHYGLTVTSIEHSLSSPDASALLGATGAFAPQRASAWAVPCATFPDMTCPAHYANPAADEPSPPTF